MAKGQGRRTSLKIHLTPQESRVLQAWQRRTTLPIGQARRGRIILLVAAGLPLAHVAQRVGISRRFVYKWVRRFQAQRLEGLVDLPRHDPWARKGLAQGEETPL